MASWPCSHIRRGKHHGSADMLRAAEPTGPVAAVTAVYSFRGPASARAATVAWNRDPAFLHIRGVIAARAGHVQVNSLYAYGGSLTTPGCTEDMRWPVPADGTGVSNAALTRCHKVIARFPCYSGYRDNNRPLQPLNGRVMKLRRSSRRQ
jgi:Eukaryotic-type carbonic anhydrase